MAQSTIIPFGPQHPVLPEPLHLDLVVEDEHVIEAIPQIGFVHRGLEKMVEKHDYNQFVYFAERICGICAFGHSLGYAETVESLLDIEIPERSEFLRVIWHELSRIHSHLLWLGLCADAFGFESLFMHCWKLREKILDIFEKTTGGRVILSVMQIGGVNRDIENSELHAIVDTLSGLQQEYAKISHTILNDYSIKNRTEGVGYIDKQTALDLSMVGPFGRASGLDYDVRKFGRAGYAHLDEFEPIVDDGGDCFARIKVRIAEVNQSINIIKEMVSKIPDGEVSIKVKDAIEDGKCASNLLEQPRGECYYYAQGNGTKNLSRMRIRTPTSQNLAGMTHALQNCDLSDVNMIILTIDPCISCSER